MNATRVRMIMNNMAFSNTGVIEEINRAQLMFNNLKAATDIAAETDDVTLNERSVKNFENALSSYKNFNVHFAANFGKLESNIAKIR